jgi:transposase-like protein
MGGQRYTPEFKAEVVKRVVDRGYTIAEVAERPRESIHHM